MKTLGTTIEGNYIVEMSKDEHWSFANLESSINGTNYGIRDYPSLTGKNLAPIFKALEDIASTKTSIYKLKEYINFLDDVFGKIK